MKILFLDIDGPIISFKGYYHTKSNIVAFDDYTLDLLTKLCMETDAQIVITSQKRIGKDRLFSQLEGVRFPKHLLHEDWCVDIFPSANRSEEIRAWLARHQEIDHFVSLDDETLDEDIPNVRVKIQYGLLFENLACLYYALGDRKTFDDIKNLCCQTKGHAEKFKDEMYLDLLKGSLCLLNKWRESYHTSVKLSSFHKNIE